MRWLEIEVDQFGPFTHWETDMDGDMVVFYGRNESGKTSVSDILKGLPFGFDADPNERRKMPRRPYKEAKLTGKVRMDDGRIVTFTRNVGWKKNEGTSEEGGRLKAMSAAYAPVAPLGRAMYSCAYSISQDQLYFPSREEWKQVEERVLTGQVDQRLQAYSNVERRLWKAAQGDPRDADDRADTETAASLRRELKAARQKQDEARDMRLRKNMVRASYNDAAARETQAYQFIKDAQSWNQKAQEYGRLKKLMETGGDAVKYKDLPANLGAIRDELDEQGADLNRQRQTMKDTLTRLNETRQSGENKYIDDIIGRKAEIERLPELRDRARAAGGHVNALKKSEDEARERFAQATDENFIGGSAKPDVMGSLEGFPLQVAAQRVKDLSPVSASPASVKTAAPASSGRFGLMYALLGLSIALLLAGIYFMLNGGALRWLMLPGLILLTVAAVYFMLSGRKSSAAADRITAGRGVPGDEYAARQAELKALLRGVTLSDALCKNPDLIPAALEKSRKALEEYRECVRQRQAAEREKAEFEQRLTDRLSDIFPDRKSGEMTCEDALKALKEAQRARRDGDETHESIRRLREELQTLVQAQNEWQARQKELAQSLAFVPGRTLSEKIETVQAARLTAQQAKGLMDDFLRQDSRAEDFILSHKDSWPYTPEACAQAEARLNQAREEKTKLASQAGGLDEALSQALTEAVPAHVASDMHLLRGEREQTEHERERTAVALALLRIANQRFLTGEQPEMIRRAGSYLRVITGNRYDLMALDGVEQNLMVHDSTTDEWVDSARSRLSRGTLEQISLCLRLSLTDQLDPGESLPICLDEVMASWDEERITQGLGLIKSITGKRQVIMFTCHKSLVDRLQKQGVNFRLCQIDN